MRTAIGILIGLAVIGVISYQIGLSEVTSALSSANPILLSVAFLATPTMALLHSEKLKKMLEFQKYEIDFWYTAKVNISSMTVNTLTPVVNAGGIPIKIYGLSQKNIPTSKVLATMFAELVFEIIAFLSTIVVLLIFTSTTNAALKPLQYLGLFLIFAALFATKILPRLASQKNIEYLSEKILPRFTKLTPQNFSKSFRHSLEKILTDKKIALLSISISFAGLVLEFARMGLILFALGVSPNITLILTIWTLIKLISTIPILPGGVGIVEGGMIPILTFLGLAPAISTSFILLERLIGLWIPVAIGTIITSRLKIPKEI